MKPDHIAKQLPSGTVTFLFTDIEGSTELLKRLGDRYSELLEDQRRIVRACTEQFGGQEVDTQGDSFFLSFPRATDAVYAAVEIQRSMADYPWPEGSDVRLRVGLRTGQPHLAEEGYIGLDVHRAARIGSLGHGGQVLLSETTAALVRDGLPEGVTLLNLGEHNLKDFQRPEPVSQLVIVGLPSEFPALQSLDTCPNNLPTEITPFVGRRKELDELERLISDPEVRLVTILGAGGMGKTRLALAASEGQLRATRSIGGKEEPRFPDGVYFVPLAPLAASDHLVSTIAKSVKFQFYEGVEPQQQLLDYFREKDMLLILDNFEHLLDGAGVVAKILRCSPGVKAFTTSRAKLSLQSEVIYPLHGMAFPEKGFAPDSEQAHLGKEYSAVRLFVENGRRARPGFELSSENLESIASICCMVEGMPLGIELAAAWTGVLSPEEIAAEIQGSLDFLSSERRDAPERHQSIRAIFDQTWKMIEEDERVVFEMLSVFQGGFTREAAESVAGASVSILKSLADKSLIQRALDGRYGIHGLLRLYAEEKVVQEPLTIDAVRDRHSEYFAQLLHKREEDIRGGDQTETLADMDNVIAGLRWAASRQNASAIRKQVQSLWWLYQFQGWNPEAEDTLEYVAGQLRTDPPSGERCIVYGQVLSLLGALYVLTSRDAEGITLLQQSQAILRQLDAQPELAWANVVRGMHDRLMDFSEAESYFKESLAIYKKKDLLWGLAFTHSWWANFIMGHGRCEEAELHYRTAMQVSTAEDDRRGLAWGIVGLGICAYWRGEYKKAEEYFQDGFHIHHSIGQNVLVGRLHMLFGDLALLMKDFEHAEEYYQNALRVRTEVGHQMEIVGSIADLGLVALHRGEFDVARERFQEALARAQDLGDFVLPGWVLNCFGDLASALGDDDEARVKYHAALEIGKTEHVPNLCLRVLSGLASVYEHAGDSIRAVEYATMVYAHPRSSTFTRGVAKAMLNGLEAKLLQETFTEAQERGKALILWETVNELLIELGRKR